MIKPTFLQPVSGEAEFYGRHLDLRRIEDAFLAKTTRSVIILGEWGTGKTSLQLVSTRRLTRKWGEQLAFLSLPPLGAIHSFHDFARELLQSLCEYLGTTIQETALAGEDNRFYLLSIGQFVEEVKRLLGSRPGQTYIVVIDGLDTLMEQMWAEEFAKVLGLIDSLVEARPALPLVFFMTMTRLPEKIKQSFASQSPSLAEVIELQPWSRPEMAELAQATMGERARLDVPLLAGLYALTGGHPYLTKVILKYLGQTDGPDQLQGATAAALKDRELQLVLGNIYHLYLQPPAQQSLILLLATLGHGLSQPLLVSLGYPFLTAARELMRRGYLTKTEEGRYYFQATFWQYWLCQWEEFDEECKRLGIDELSERLAPAAALPT